MLRLPGPKPDSGLRELNGEVAAKPGLKPPVNPDSGSVILGTDATG
jgi:hypothetical protein